MVLGPSKNLRSCFQSLFKISGPHRDAADLKGQGSDRLLLYDDNGAEEVGVELKCLEERRSSVTGVAKEDSALLIIIQT